MTKLNKDSLLLSIYEDLKILEKQNQDFSSELTSELEKRWEDLKTSYPKIYELKRVFKNGWNPRKISDLTVGLERVLGLHLVETDFLVSTTDQTKKTAINPPLEIALDSIRSAFNVGGFLRTAEALGIKQVHLLGYTPGPEDLPVQKTALGTEKRLQITHWPSREDFFKSMNEKDFHIVAMETSASAKAITEAWPQKPTLLVFGNERFGLDHTALTSSHEVRQIELFGEKNSFNVVVSAGITIHEWIRQWRNL